VTYTEIPDGKGKCPECGKICYRTWGSNGMLIVHGPRKDRCPGSGKFPVSWLDTTGLPAWESMSDLDRGAALLHAAQRHTLGDLTAVSRYPARYFNDPDLILLSPEIASEHARYVTLSWPAAVTLHGSRTVTRLYQIALAADRERLGNPAGPYEDGRAVPPPCPPSCPARRSTGSRPGENEKLTSSGPVRPRPGQILPGIILAGDAKCLREQQMRSAEFTDVSGQQRAPHGDLCRGVPRVAGPARRAAR
jgi:hypothetical protein